jgi:hypothetical protein
MTQRWRFWVHILPVDPLLTHWCTQVYRLSQPKLAESSQVRETDASKCVWQQRLLGSPSSFTHVHKIRTPTLPTLLTFTYTQVLWFLSRLTRSRVSDVITRPDTRFTIISTRATQCTHRETFRSLRFSNRRRQRTIEPRTHTLITSSDLPSGIPKVCRQCGPVVSRCEVSWDIHLYWICHKVVVPLRCVLVCTLTGIRHCMTGWLNQDRVLDRVLLKLLWSWQRGEPWLRVSVNRSDDHMRRLSHGHVLIGVVSRLIRGFDFLVTQ